MEVLQAPAPVPLVQPQHGKHDSSLKPKATFTFIERLKLKFSALPPIPVGITKTNPQIIRSNSTTNESTDLSAVPSLTRSSNAETAATTRTDATSILFIPAVFSFNKVHVAPMMAIDVETQSIWENSVRRRLRQILVHEVTTGSCSQELMMAGRKAKNLKPTIVVTCGDLMMRKRVEKVFKSPLLAWLRELLKANRMHFVAAVKQVDLSASTGSNGLSPGAIAGIAVAGAGLLLLVFAVQLFYWQRRIARRRKSVADRYNFQESGNEKEDNTLTQARALSNVLGMPGSQQCILRLRHDATTFCGQQVSSATQNFTLGGLILVGDHLYGLSAAHPFAAEAVTQQAMFANHSSITPYEDRNGDSSCNNASEPFWFGVDDDLDVEDIDDQQTTVQAAPNNVADGTQEVEKRTELAAAVDSHIQRSNQGAYLRTLRLINSSIKTDSVRDINLEDQQSNSDWSLISMSSTSPLLPNLLIQVNNPFDTPIVTTAPTPAQGEVLVLHNGQTYSGCLRALLSTIQIRQTTYDVQMISLNDVLPSGCSGSWVVADGRLCGHIISIRADVPFAYMVPIDVIFDDIKGVMKTDAVRLPTWSDIENSNGKGADSVNMHVSSSENTPESEDPHPTLHIPDQHVKEKKKQRKICGMSLFLILAIIASTMIVVGAVLGGVLGSRSRKAPSTFVAPSTTTQTGTTATSTETVPVIYTITSTEPVTHTVTPAATSTGIVPANHTEIVPTSRPGTLSAGAIAGVVLGNIAVIVFLMTMFCYVKRR